MLTRLPLPRIVPLGLFVSMIFMLSGCLEPVKLTTQPTGKVSRMDAMYFEFSEELAPKDSLNQWIEAEFITFDPPASGKFQWVEAHRLKFTPESPFDAARNYTATVNKEVLMGKKLGTAFDTIRFHTPMITMLEPMVSWYDRDRYGFDSPVEILLSFNGEISLPDLKNYLTVYRGKEKIENLEVAGYGHNTSAKIYLEGLQNSTEKQEFHIEVKEGLPTEYDYAQLKTTERASATLYPASELRIQSVKSRHSDGKQSIQLTASQKIKPEILRSYLTITPETPFKLNANGNDIRIRGDFKPGTLINIAIRKGMPGLRGGTLKEDYSYNLSLPDLKPFLRFADKDGHYLMRNGFENVNVKCVNVSGFEVRLYEVFENNLLHFLNRNRYSFNDYNYYDDEFEYFYGYGDGVDVSDYGRLMSVDSVFPDKDAENVLQNIPINVGKQMRSKFEGIYAMEISNSEDRWMADSKIISLSDIGLVAKRSEDEIIVFVNALSSARPLPGTAVQLRTATNQVLATVTTNGDGVARFTNLKARLSEGESGWKPRLITAQRGRDFNYLDLRNTEIDNGRWDIDAKDKTQYDAFLYADRDLYRPGDTAHFAAILRDWDIAALERLPLRFQITGPSGDIIADLKKSTNAQGSFEASIPLPLTARTGSYRAQVLTASENMLQTIAFNVEEFVPDKIKVEIGGGQRKGRPGDTLSFPLAASYYFGSTCADHRYEYRIRFDQYGFRSRKYSDFDFRLDRSGDADIPTISNQSTLNKQGMDTILFQIPSDLPTHGNYSGKVYATVFDNSGRTVARSTTLDIVTRDSYVGIKSPGSYYSVQDNFNMEIVAVDNEDRAIRDYPVVIEVQRYDWKQSMRNHGGRYVYVSESEPLTIRKDTLYLSGKSHRFQMRIREAGNYAVNVHPLNEPKALHSTKFSAYGKEVATASSFGVDREGAIEIKADKSAYNSGENARLLFTTPFSGRMLVTLEREKVYQYYYVNVTNNSAELVLPLRAQHVPNLVVTATLFRPQRNSRTLPMTVAHGHTHLKVDNLNLELPIKIQAPGIVKPGVTTFVTVKTIPRKDVYVTLSVVDEGILSMTGFQTPDPFKHMYSARQSEVHSYDMYKYLLPEIASAQGATGGGEGSGGNYKVLNPIQAKRFQSVAVWSGILRTNSAGIVRVPVTVPKEFNGKVRMMAVAHQGKRFGSGAAWITIRDDVVMMPGLPRFATAGDTFMVPVNLLNTTKLAGKAEISLKVEGPLEILGSKMQVVSLEKEGSGLASFRVHTTEAIGVAKVQVNMQGMETAQHDIELAVRPPSPMESEGGTGSIAAGKTVSVNIPGGFYPQLHESKLRISRFPALKLGKHLEYLLRYPHGCAEQTTSAVFPQLYFPELAELIAPELYKSSNAVYHIREAIRKLEGMQMYQGNFSYWPGSDYGNDWASIYVTHFLLEAQKAGYAVNKSTLDNAISYLQEHASDKATFTYTFFRDKKRMKQEKAKKEAIYGIYVLALAGQPDLPIMNYYRSHVDLLTGDTRYLLAAAFAMSGDMQGFEDLLPKSFEPEEAQRLTGGSFDSAIRANAMMLNALLEADPDHPRVQYLIEYLNDRMDEIYSTQDRAWAFMALGKALKQQSNSAVEIEVLVNGQLQGTFTGKNLKLNSTNWQGKKLEMKASGKGEVYFYWGIEGIRSGNGVQTKDRDNGLRISRKYFLADGRELLQPMLKQGELVVCKLKLYAKEKVENVAITDMIPAGLEIENTRLSKGNYAWVKGMNKPGHLDARDDRALYYTDLNANQTREFAYLMRAVGQGSFLLPPIGAEAMYDPNIHSFHSGDTVYVYPPDTELPEGRLGPFPVVDKEPGTAVAKNPDHYPSPHSTWSLLRLKM